LGAEHAIRAAIGRKHNLAPHIEASIVSCHRPVREDHLAPLWCLERHKNQLRRNPPRRRLLTKRPGPYLKRLTVITVLIEDRQPALLRPRDQRRQLQNLSLDPALSKLVDQIPRRLPFVLAAAVTKQRAKHLQTRLQPGW